MRARLLTATVAGVIAGLLGATGAPWARTPVPEVGPEVSVHEKALELANRCLRRGDLPCAEREAKLASAPEAEPAIRREALVVLVTVSGLGGESAHSETRARCSALLTVWPGYEPPPGAAPSVVVACREARQALLETRLPKIADPPVPLLPPEEAFPPPAIYKPAHLADLPPEEKRLSISIAAGLALPLGDSADRFEAGIQAMVDFRFELSEALALWLQGALALLRLDADLPVEPHQGTSLTVFSATAGLEYRSPLARDLELTVGLGLGVGGFGLASADEAMGLGLSPSVGVRYLAAENLAVRGDLAPTIVVPFSDVAVGSHLGFVVRGEARF